MAGAIEVIDEPGFGSGGSFAPKADQKRFRSMFACVDGKKAPGWMDEHSARSGVVSQDGRRRLRYEEFTGENKQRNQFTVNGMTVKEMVVPVEAALEFEQHAAGISKDRVDAYNQIPEALPPSANNVGIRVLESANISVPLNQT